jgi:hypothetical protein
LVNWPIWSIGISVNFHILSNLESALDLHSEIEEKAENRMLRIHRSENGGVVFVLIGQMDQETVAELETLINSEASGRHIALNLKDLTLVNEDAVIFLERCESNHVTLEDCPPYIREWINRQRQRS